MKILRLLVYIWFSILAGDLLILYYSGAWYDPNRFIEMAKIVILFLFVGLGIFMVIKEIKNE